jgi:hypothetical protein
MSAPQEPWCAPIWGWLPVPKPTHGESATANVFVEDQLDRVFVPDTQQALFELAGTTSLSQQRAIWV